MSPPTDAQLDHRKFILENTCLMAPPLVPEVKLHLAEESLPLWEKTEEELGEMNVPPPYWAFAWAGGQALARYLLDNRKLCDGKRVCDLGAGSGLCAIAAHIAGARAVEASDIDPFSGHAIALNADANDASIEILTTDILDADPGDVDVLLIGDLFYEKELAERILAYGEGALRVGAKVLAGDPSRNFFPVDRFDKVAEYSVPVTRALEDSEIKRTAVWELSPKP